MEKIHQLENPDRLVVYFGEKVALIHRSHNYFKNFNLFGMDIAREMYIGYNIKKQYFKILPPLEWDTNFVNEVVLDSDGNIAQVPQDSMELHQELNHFVEN